MINSNVAPILHRFRDVAFDRSKIAISGYPSCAPTEGENSIFVGDDAGWLILGEIRDGSQVVWALSQNIGPFPLSERNCYVGLLSDKYKTVLYG